jgi:hypothetical protein
MNASMGTPSKTKTSRSQQRPRQRLKITIVSDDSLEMASRWLTIADGVALPASEDVVGDVVDGAASCADRVVADVVSD